MYLFSCCIYLKLVHPLTGIELTVYLSGPSKVCKPKDVNITFSKEQMLTYLMNSNTKLEQKCKLKYSGLAWQDGLVSKGTYHCD